MVERPQLQSTKNIDRKKNLLDRTQQPQSLRYEREVVSSFPRLGENWKREIAKSYEKFTNKSDVKAIFEIAKKYNKKDIPQSMIAVALLDYADSVHSGQVVPANFEALLQAQWNEYTKMKKLQQEFESKKTDADFADYTKFVAKANVKQPVTIQQIRQSRGFSVNTFLFAQYLEKSFATSKNKEAIFGKLSKDSQTAFVEYTQSNQRLSKIVQLPPEFIDAVENKKDVSQSTRTNNTENKSFSEAGDMFARDIASENGPKKMLEDVDSSVFGETWLSKQDLEMFRAMLKNLPLERWTFFLGHYSEGKLPMGVTANVMKQYVDTGNVPKNISKEVLDQCFQKVVLAYFVTETKKRMEEFVLKEYFSQVAGILQVGGNHIHLVANQTIDYQKDGSITMKYETTTGLQGNISIDQNGKVCVDSLIGYDETQGMNYNIQPMQKILEGGLPSVVQMLSRASIRKDVFYLLWKEQLEKEESTIGNIDTAKFFGDVVTQQDETARKNIEQPMRKELLLMQCTDRLAAFSQQIVKMHGVDPKQDIFLRYLQDTKQENGLDKGSLVQSDNPILKPLFALRQKIMQLPAQQAEHLVQGLDDIVQTFAGVPFKKEQYPFVVEGMIGNEDTLGRTNAAMKKSNYIDRSTDMVGSSQNRELQIHDKSSAENPLAGKKTLRSFLSFFCIGQDPAMDFDSVSFDRAVTKIKQNKNDIGVLSTLLPTEYSVSLDSLYYRNNPTLANQTAELIGAKKLELGDLREEVLGNSMLGEIE